MRENEFHDHLHGGGAAAFEKYGIAGSNDRLQVGGGLFTRSEMSSMWTSVSVDRPSAIACGDELKIEASSFFANSLCALGGVITKLSHATEDGVALIGWANRKLREGF
jgi:hypothetical protein